MDDLRRHLTWQTAVLAELGRPAAASPTRFAIFADLLNTATAELTGLVVGDQAVGAATSLNGNLRTPHWLRRT